MAPASIFWADSSFYALPRDRLVDDVLNLGTYQPRRHDSIRDAMAPGSTFMASFRQALQANDRDCIRPDCCSFFDFEVDGEVRLAPSAFDTVLDESILSLDDDDDVASSTLQYPLLLFAAFPSLPNGEILNQLLREFQDNFVLSTPFLPLLELPRSGGPPYLVVTMALLGAAISEDAQCCSWTDSLWRASYAILLGAVEVDTTLARKLDWVHAVPLPLSCFFEVPWIRFHVSVEYVEQSRADLSHLAGHPLCHVWNSTGRFAGMDKDSGVRWIPRHCTYLPCHSV